MMEIEVTADGSETIFIPEWKERYHSKNGALQESIYVYIQKGLEFITKQKIKILEIGFGTGLNALLTLVYQKPLSTICYTTLEPSPLPENIYNRLNYINLDIFKNYSEVFTQLHELEEGTPLEVHNHFTFIKYFRKIQDFQTKEKYDLVYWDAFGPRVQPEMWSLELCQKMYDLLDLGGTVVTYCSQGQFKRNLKSAGFEVEVLPGPPFKREMTRAVKKIDL